jgi:serine/threonine-protein kinase
MAPEQWSGASPVDARSDLWALGMILYEMLTGGVPHERRRPAERQALLLAGAIPSLRTVRPEITAAVEAVVVRCLRADPDKRWRSARRLAAALREARPDVEMLTEGLPVTRSDVTAFDPAAHRPEALARAFAPEAARSAPARPTEAASQAVTPRAAPPTFPGRGGLPEPPPSDDFDEATEVSVPRFTADELPAVAPMRHGPTLRSFEAPPDVLPTLQVAAVPVQTRSAPPATVAASPRPIAPTSYAPPAFRSVPPSPDVPLARSAAPVVRSAGAPRSPWSARSLGLVALGLALSVALVLAIVLLAMRC